MDIVTGPAGVPADRPIIGFQFYLIYNPAVVHVTGFDANFLLAAAANSQVFNVSDVTPDTDGRFEAGALDLTGEPAADSGPGVLARITFSAVGQGTTDLAFVPLETVLVDTLNQQIAVQNISGGHIVVDDPVGCPDGDGDGASDQFDNCPSVPNPLQQDFDGDSIGDACDPDVDGDGVLNDSDLCPSTPHTGWNPVDVYGCSNLDVDQDGDRVCDPGAPSGGPSACTGSDNCPVNWNRDQSDVDGDGLGDVCDPDADNDGIPKTIETSMVRLT